MLKQNSSFEFIYFMRLLFIANTIQELHICLQHAIDCLKSSNHPITAISSGSELFLRFITLATLDTLVSPLAIKYNQK